MKIVKYKVINSDKISKPIFGDIVKYEYRKEHQQTNELEIKF